mmetsp:Transcript_13936/g.35034  ORF Transcript_13936/g.35034 Transcript_13936/m.35034 type:complete len:208 (+) Transcript_13936:301-924(+)
MESSILYLACTASAVRRSTCPRSSLYFASLASGSAYTPTWLADSTTHRIFQSLPNRSLPLLRSTSAYPLSSVASSTSSRSDTLCSPCAPPSGPALRTVSASSDPDLPMNSPLTSKSSILDFQTFRPPTSTTASPSMRTLCAGEPCRTRRTNMGPVESWLKKAPVAASVRFALRTRAWAASFSPSRLERGTIFPVTTSLTMSSPSPAR